MVKVTKYFTVKVSSMVYDILSKTLQQLQILYKIIACDRENDMMYFNWRKKLKQNYIDKTL